MRRRQAGAARAELARAGALSLEEARRIWWEGLRAAEAEEYARLGQDFAADEPLFRHGFEAALHPRSRGQGSYAALEVLKQAAEAAKTLDPKKVAAQIKSGQKFKTVIGELSYDKKGDITRLDYVMYVWKKGADGKITYIEEGAKPGT